MIVLKVLGNCAIALKDIITLYHIVLPLVPLRETEFEAIGFRVHGERKGRWDVLYTERHAWSKTVNIWMPFDYKKAIWTYLCPSLVMSWNDVLLPAMLLW